MARKRVLDSWEHKDKVKDFHNRPAKREFDTKPSEITNKLAAVLNKNKGTVLLATIPSSKKGNPPYSICLTKGNLVTCGCKSYLYSDEKNCKHLDTFRSKFPVYTKPFKQ
jgi:hypothetical protein